MKVVSLLKLAPLLALVWLQGCATVGTGTGTAAGTGSSAAASGRPGAEVSAEAAAAYEQQDWAAAEVLYAELVTLLPQNAEYWFRLGNCYTRTGKPDEAVVAYREALVRDPELSKAWYNMGLVQLRQSVNSFQQMSQYAEAGSKQRQIGESVYRAILEILSRDYASQ